MNILISIRPFPAGTVTAFCRADFHLTCLVLPACYFINAIAAFKTTSVSFGTAAFPFFAISWATATAQEVLYL